MSRAAAKNTENAARVVRSWIDGFQPDHLIVEDPAAAYHKGKCTRAILVAIASVVGDADGLDIWLKRKRLYQNKYEEAKALVSRYPEMASRRPSRPPIWMPEPRNMSYFEALSLVEQLNASA